MSVDFYHCECCGESIYEEYVAPCAKCQQNVCSKCALDHEDDYMYVIELGQMVREDDPEEYDKVLEEIKKYGLDEDAMDDCGFHPKHCPFCSGIKVSDEQIIEYCLKQLSQDRDTIIQKIKDEIKIGDKGKNGED